MEEEGSIRDLRVRFVDKLLEHEVGQFFEPINSTADGVG